MSDAPTPPELREDWLDGLEGAERTQRRRLLIQLAEQGFSPEEIDRAVADNRLALLPVDRVLGAVHTARDVERLTGLPMENVVRIRRLIGLAEADPEDRVFTDADVEAARAVRLFLGAGISEEAIEETTAVLGEGMGRAAAAITSQFLEAFLQPGDSEAEVAERFATLAAQLTPAFIPVLNSVFTTQLRASVSRGVVGQAELISGARDPEQTVAVCFVDMVGFTRLGGQMDVLELGSLAARLARLAGTAVRPPVRLIKTIGDAAMFVSPDASALVDVALRVLEGAGAQEMPSLRAGIAYGLATERAGDYYGNTVNLASRVTGIARPDSVLCTEEVRGLAQERFSFSGAGRHRLKGVAHPPTLYRARRR